MSRVLVDSVENCINRTFVRYMNSAFPNVKNFFKEWDIDKLKMDVAKWNVRVKWLKLYILSNNSKKHRMSCYVGCSENLARRLKQHNGHIPGGPSETRKAMGKWRVAFCATLPPFRNFRGRDLVNECKSGRGGLFVKIIRSIECAMARGLLFRISRKIVDPYSAFYIKGVHKYVRNLEKIGTLNMESVLF